MKQKFIRTKSLIYMHQLKHQDNHLWDITCVFLPYLENQNVFNFNAVVYAG